MEERKGYCLTCRAEKSGRYCPSCGEELLNAAPTGVCGRCSMPLADGFNFCPGCALPIDMAKKWKPGQAAPETPIAVGSQSKPEAVYVECHIVKSAFTEERVVYVDQVEGPRYVGFVPAHYCFTPDRAAFEAEPVDEAAGLVAGRLVEVDGEAASVYLPSGETVVVRASLVSAR